MFSVELVCPSVCLQATLLKNYEQIAMKYYGGIQGGKMNEWLNLDGDLGLLRWIYEQKTP